MKLATTTADFGDYDICESIKHICEAGFRYIDLSLNVTEKCSKLFKNNFDKKAALLSKDCFLILEQ